MIFSIQRYLEDYIERRQLRDVDQYSVALANLYAAKRSSSSKPEFQKSVRRIKTVFFRNNPALKRVEFERDMVARLDERFLKKKTFDGLPTVFPGGVTRERIRLRARRRSMAGLLQQFKAAVEARAVDSLWVSRKRGELRPRPERIAQALLGVFFRRVLSDDGGFAMREVGSGVGFVDLVAVLSRTAPHIIEMKVLRGRFEGPEQLHVYMKQEGRQVGWLVVMDARRQSKRAALPTTVTARGGGVVRVVVVEVNPTAPSKRASSSD